MSTTTPSGSLRAHAADRTLSISGPAIPVFGGIPMLEPVRLWGQEGMNGLFEYQLLLKTPDALNIDASGAADIDLDSFVGREIGCRIALDGAGVFVAGAAGSAPDRIGAGHREINALITKAEFLGEAGRHIEYRLTLRPWLDLATWRTDCRIFQNKTVVDILDEVLGRYVYPVDKRLIETYPARDYQTQFNESDFAFFSRLCQEWGINYFFEHSRGAHRLVLIDNMGAHALQPSTAYHQLDYHPPGWKADAEYIHSFVQQSQLASGRYTTRDYDYTRPRADLTVARQDARPTGHADAEVYQWHAAFGGSHYAQPRAGNAEVDDVREVGRQLALLRMQALRTDARRSLAKGNLRAMVPGCSFSLHNHPRQSANVEYLVLETCFLIEEVGQDSQIREGSQGRRQQWRVEVEFTAHPMAEPLRPALTQPKPAHCGVQTALVVGPPGDQANNTPGQNIWTDELGRIKVQFHWDRHGQKNQHSSCWVRVVSTWAGNQMGAMHVPRIGQEVVVDFSGADADLPICVGRINNQVNLPPWSLPSQAALSGFRSRELAAGGGNSAAGRSNHLLLDDTAGKIQVQLKSDHQDSQLSLGHISRVEDNAGLKDERGDGFELRTDAHGVVRAAEGLLISAEACIRAAGHAKDLGEAINRLILARDLVEGQAAAARDSQAQTKDDQDAVARALKKLNDTIKGTGGKEQKGQKGHFPELAEPHLVLATPSGMALTSGGSTHIASAEHTQITSSKHTSINSGESLIVVALQAFKAYAMENGMEMVAAQADIDIRALKNSIRLSAKDKIELTADEIHITAKTRLTINGGTSYGEYVSGSITKGTTGKYTQHAGSHRLTSANSRPTRPFSGDACNAREAAADAGASSVARA